MGRKILGGITGLVVAFIVMICLEAITHQIYPPPEGLDLTSPDALKAFVASLPMGAFLLLSLSYALSSLSGGLVATLVAGRSTPVPAIVVGALLTVGGIVNFLWIPHPAWFIVVSLLIYVPLAYLGARLAMRAQPAY